MKVGFCFDFVFVTTDKFLSLKFHLSKKTDSGFK